MKLKDALEVIPWNTEINVTSYTKGVLVTGKKLREARPILINEINNEVFVIEPCYANELILEVE